MKRNMLVLAIATILCLGVINAQNGQGQQKTEKNFIDDNDILFEGFKVKFAKTYATQEENGAKRKNFEQNLQKLKQNTECKACGITSMFDMSQADLDRLTGAVIKEAAQEKLIDQIAKNGELRQETVPARVEQTAKSSTTSKSSSSALTVGATSLDWRTSNIVTRVKNQGGCGSCWAFASIALFESELARTRPAQFTNTVDLSEQYLLNCDTSSSGCNGGSCASAGNLLISKGARFQTTYSYNYSTTYPGICTSTPEVTFTGLRQYYYQSSTTKMSDANIISLVDVRPIIIYLYASTFYQYRPNTNRTFSCTKTDSSTIRKINHAVLLVGYTETEWIIKNSWGESWGTEGGYIYISRTRANNCGIGFVITTLY